jgi:uncharacterized membrane protein YbaN (DUF454 family)
VVAVAGHIAVLVELLVVVARLDLDLVAVGWRVAALAVVGCFLGEWLYFVLLCAFLFLRLDDSAEFVYMLLEHFQLLLGCFARGHFLH